MGTIYLLRHGQASFGTDHYDRLSNVGHQQARVLGQALKARGVQAEVRVSGSMQRHHETAAGALLEMGLTQPVQTHAGVNEFDHENVIEVAEPRYADKALMMAEMAASDDPRAAFQRFFKQAVMRWVEGQHAQDYKEPWADFKSRVLSAFGDIVAQTPIKGSSVVFTSGGAISVVCAHLLGLPDSQAFTLNWTLANAGITKIQAGRDGLHLLSVNEHAHMESAQPSLLTYR